MYFCHFVIAFLYGAESWTFRKIDHKYMESFEKWCWRIIQKFSWADRVRNEVVLRRVKEKRNILHTENKRKADWIGHVLGRNCFIKHVIGGNTEENKVWLEYEKEDVSSHLMILRKREDTGHWKRKHKLALSGKIGLEFLWIYGKTD